MYTVLLIRTQKYTVVSKNNEIANEALHFPGGRAIIHVCVDDLEFEYLLCTRQLVSCAG